ncbi:hypothetical protein LX32DRAFT_247868 [Colletotrichum zoysiae]|uniref:Uncharacterized protein n=1 Tax=Colletotrichum zoysiae TaxID=1216348 RepID=A0AAD9H3Q9_9PEZI|nr:hypothetical protein LX32DRAFT_247868 [Colletotrichum zoysiae]
MDGKQVPYTRYLSVLLTLRCHSTPPPPRMRQAAVSTKRRSNRSWPDVIQLGVSRRNRDSTRPCYHDHYSLAAHRDLPTYLLAHLHSSSMYLSACNACIGLENVSSHLVLTPVVLAICPRPGRTVCLCFCDANRILSWSSTQSSRRCCTGTER